LTVAATPVTFQGTLTVLSIMVVFLNGRLLAEEAALVSVFDRGFLFGDGLFETLRVVRSRPFLWDAHMERFTHGADVLKLRPPLTSVELRRAADRLVELNSLPNAVLRITLTRGPGPRGYSPKGADRPTLAMTLHAAPRIGSKKHASARLITSSYRVSADDPLANVKTCNKLPHILARAEADAAGADDALLLNARGQLAESTASNLFWLSGDVVLTPPGRAGALMGITRRVVFELAGKLGLATSEVDDPPSALRHAAGVFLTNSISGITEVVELDGKALHRSAVVARLQAAYEALLRQYDDSHRVG
ncbi:MAG: aminotransferase class IV, partial [Polaromonas sp.]